GRRRSGTELVSGSARKQRVQRRRVRFVRIFGRRTGGFLVGRGCTRPGTFQPSGFLAGGGKGGTGVLIEHPVAAAAEASRNQQNSDVPWSDHALPALMF